VPVETSLEMRAFRRVEFAGRVRRKKRVQIEKGEAEKVAAALSKANEAVVG
jgi:hypothetical protein